MHSLFELFKVGVGPSSSHTVGPMIAAKRFAMECNSEAILTAVQRVVIELYGSLALTGLGHATDGAVLAGLSGLHPAEVEVDAMQRTIQTIRESGQLGLNGEAKIPFDVARDLLFHRNESLPFHPNAVRFTAFGEENATLLSRVFYSVGGGFVLRDDETTSSNGSVSQLDATVPYPFCSAEELLQMCHASQLSIAEIVDRNERVWRDETAIANGIDRLWMVMQGCIERGCQTEGVLPGGLQVERRAPRIARQLLRDDYVKADIDELLNPSCRVESPEDKQRGTPMDDALNVNDWVSLFALAVNEENAAGGKVVTAPTNGAAGIVPAVLAYYQRFYPGANREGIHIYFKTAAAIGMLYKRNASLSAAEMGCQGEVGVACSMAAGGLAACMGGTPDQIENAAEIGMEHNLGLTCDPVRGLVQIPCIERNTMGATKAINAARLAVLYGDGRHRVSLDRVIETMRQTGVDMQSKYKETSLGGLAVNVVNC
jgi:L-serine dehydratase